MATSDKYDRQLRLWGSNGQKALMNSKILLINADSVGTETLKNLVLPGVGMFTILDDFIVKQEDLGSNFFVLPSHLGKPRAEIATELLCEMNSDVTGHARVANFKNVLQTGTAIHLFVEYTLICYSEPEFFNQFNLIITANLPENQLKPLADICWDSKIPLLITRSYGLIGSVRLQLRDHDIIESRPEAERFDLRIAHAFPALVDYCNSIDLASLESIEHSHIPYIVLLYKAIEQWKSTHNGASPSTFAEKTQFREQIKGMSRNFNNEVNFQEAERESYRAYDAQALTDELQSVLDKHSSVALTSTSKHFDFLVTALRTFMQSHQGRIPLSGQIPDLTSTTELYVQLQQVYVRKAAEDLRAYKSILGGLLEAAGLAASAVPDDLIDTFCKNALNLQSVSTRSLTQELAEEPECGTVAEALSDEPFDDPLQTPVLWYLALRAIDAFHSQHARYPGINDDQLVSDQEEVFSQLRAIVTRYQVDSSLVEGGGDVDAMSMEDGGSSVVVTRAHATEIVRYGDCVLHNISAMVGGIASQEAVKIITHQYVPLNNTYIYNGIASCGATYEL